MSANGETNNPLDDRPKAEGARVTDTSIHVRKTVKGEGEDAVETFSVAAGGRTYLLDGTQAAAEERIKAILDDIN